MGVSSARLLALPVFLASAAGAKNALSKIFGLEHVERTYDDALKWWFELGVLGSVSHKMLSGMDRVIKSTARNNLHWPSDTPMDMFHDKEDAGGLGIPLLQVCILS